MKYKFNFIQPNISVSPWHFHKFVFLFSIEKWNHGSDPYEIRINILFWEINFSVYKNNKS